MLENLRQCAIHNLMKTLPDGAEHESRRSHFRTEASRGSRFPASPQMFIGVEGRFVEIWYAHLFVDV